MDSIKPVNYSLSFFDRQPDQATPAAELDRQMNEAMNSEGSDVSGEAASESVSARKGAKGKKSSKSAKSSKSSKSSKSAKSSKNESNEIESNETESQSPVNSSNPFAILLGTEEFLVENSESDSGEVSSNPFAALLGETNFLNSDSTSIDISGSDPFSALLGMYTPGGASQEAEGLTEDLEIGVYSTSKVGANVAGAFNGDVQSSELTPEALLTKLRSE